MCIRVNHQDNVAIIVDPEGVAKGTGLAGGTEAREWIPQSHKMALHQLEAGQPVLRYGQTIGFANRTIPAGVLGAGRNDRHAGTAAALIDIDAGWEIFRVILDVASGRQKTWAEHWGLANALSPFNPGPVT